MIIRSMHDFDVDLGIANIDLNPDVSMTPIFYNGASVIDLTLIFHANLSQDR